MAFFTAYSGGIGIGMRTLVAAGILIAASTRATELRVGAGAQFATIREAIAGAQPGDVIRVGPGIYEGNLTLDKTVQLIGDGRPVIRGSGAGSVVEIRAPKCVLRGFRIERSGASLMDEDSGILLRSSGNQILDNELRDILFGIYFYRSNDNVVRGNTVTGRAQLEQGERGAGLHFWDCLRNTIENNVVTAARDGMYLQNASESVIRGNRVSNVRYGLHYMYSNDNVFEGNVFENSVAGAAIMYSTRIRMRSNQFRHNRGFSSFGILFQDSTDITVESNIISDNGAGIFAEALRGSAFRRNLISANDVALEMFASAEANTFVENNFIANLTPIHVIGRTTSTRWSAGGRGNYWSEYDGYDLDGDGIGDVPFQIRNLYEKLEGNHPRLRLYFQSPAAQALVAAERAFPIMRTAAEADDRPLMRPVDLGLHLPESGEGGRFPIAGLTAIGASVFGGALLFRGRRA
jgi:nitrous oxidase accessory protein